MALRIPIQSAIMRNEEESGEPESCTSRVITSLEPMGTHTHGEILGLCTLGQGHCFHSFTSSPEESTSACSQCREIHGP